MTDKKEMIRFNLDVSPEVHETLEKLAQKIGGTKSDVLRQAIALMQIAIIAKENGKKFGIVETNQDLTTEIMIP
ncbi:DNA-binding protein [Scytonema sp. NUACC26]|uniref:DNA-binding protein n=1 Tax=Scytonema sp. NUACC26 TaxID=3140176 RepID=UPI0034DC9029